MSRRSRRAATSTSPPRACSGRLRVPPPGYAGLRVAPTGIGRDGTRVRDLVGEAARPRRGRRGACGEPRARCLLRGPGPRERGLRSVGRPGRASAPALRVARSGRRDLGCRHDPGPLSRPRALRRTSGDGRAAGLGTAGGLRGFPGVPDGGDAAGPAPCAAAGRGHGCPGDRTALRRQHHGCGARHPGDAVPARARARHHALRGGGGPPRPCGGDGRACARPEACGRS